MGQSPMPEHPARANPTCQRLLIAQMCLYAILLPCGSIYLFLHIFSQTGFWLSLMRLMLSASCIALALVENSLRCHARPASAPPVSEGPQSSRHHFLPSALHERLNWIQQHLLISLVATFVSLAMATLNLLDGSDIREISVSGGLIGLAALACFALLVVERMLSFRPLHGLKYQYEHIGMARVMLSTSVLIGVAMLMASPSPLIAAWIIRLSSLIPLLIALEVFLRLIMETGSPLPEGGSPRFLVRSTLFSLYRWPLRPWVMLSETLRQRFGIDIREIKAFRLIGQRLVPVIAAMVVLGWLLSGLTEVAVHQRGIYERFGRPVAVLAPGLHTGLPWPFGQVLTIENGTVHELQVGDITDAKSSPVDAVNEEGPAPQTSWRLWDNNHAADQSQVIASTASGRQNFQIVNMDIRLIWRVGLSPRDALNSQYQAEQLPELIRSIARQVLVKQFASARLDTLLSGQQTELSAELNQQIQKRLTTLNTGVELLFTRIEAIHPPAGAADAWHGVQAAQIAEEAVIAREKGYAASVNSSAQNQAVSEINAAQAQAAENLSHAGAAAVNFAAEHQAWQLAGNAFITERRYQILSQALTHSPLLILDSHLSEASSPVLDFRQNPELPDSTAAQKASAK
jgi:regulator of protease activity HflC (stomatin/prohibitin superfamily)